MRKLVKATLFTAGALALLAGAAQAGLAAAFGLTLREVLSQELPVTDATQPDFPESLLLPSHSYFEKQQPGQCGGFSAAYVLRELGCGLSGADCYAELDYKKKNGYVLPQALTEAIRRRGYSVSLLRCTADQLKTHLAAGIPVIVLIGYGRHYATVVGYDSEGFLLYDSNKDPDNSAGFNRVLPNEQFEAQWNNKIPLFGTVCFLIGSKAE